MPPRRFNAPHESFFLSDRKLLHVFLVGTGLIRSAPLNMIRDQFSKLAKENMLEVNVMAVANSRKMFFSDTRPGPLPRRWTMVKEEGEEMGMPAFAARMIACNLPNSIFVDCTSSEEVTAVYREILEANISIVTPNKKG